MRIPLTRKALLPAALGIAALILSACGPMVNTTISHNRYDPLPADAQVVVLSETDPVPAEAEPIGQTSIYNSSVSQRAGYDFTVEKAKTEARSKGSNLLKITKLIPKTKGQNKFELYADIMHIPENSMFLTSVPQSNDTLARMNFAKIYFFRPTAGMVNYDLYINDQKIGTTRDNWKQEATVEARPGTEIWGQTESKQKLVLDIEPGATYFIRCGLKMGDNIGVPVFEIIDREEGIKLYNTIP